MLITIMTNFQKILEELIRKEGGQEIVADNLGIKASYISMFVNGKRDISKSVAKSLEEYYGYNAEELLKIQKMEKLGLKISNEDFTSDLKNEPKQLINPTVKETLAQLDKVQNGKKKSYPIETEGIEVDDDLLIKNKATVIPIAGQAGLESAMYDPILFSELKTEVYEHPKKLSGEYFKIEVKGNSMYDGTDEGLKEGDWAYCRSLERRHWQERLHTHNWKNWCFFHGERGIIFKCIESYNIETGEIHLYSRNPDKKEYPNFTIKISECTYICNVVEKRQSFNQ